MVQRFDPTRLTERRKAAGKTRERLAVDIGRSYGTVSAWERGECPPPADSLANLAAACGCSLLDFYTVSDEAVSA